MRRLGSITIAVLPVLLLVGVIIPVGISTPAMGAPPIALPRSAWTAVDGASITRGPEANSIRVHYKELYWGGAWHAKTPSCDYRFSGEARSVSGPGYGFAIRTVFDEGIPTARSFQYDYGNPGRLRDTIYPSDYGWASPIVTDRKWHRVSVEITGKSYRMHFDGKEIFSRSADDITDCGGGLYLRVWSGSVSDFRNLTVEPLP
jgi:hypothetical protein